MACRPEYRDRLVDFARGALSDTEADSVLEHALGCPECGSDLDLFSDLTETLGRTLERQKAGPRAAAPGRTPPVIYFVRRWGAAAAAALVVATVAVWALLPGDPRLVQLADTTPLPFIDGTLRSGDQENEPRFERAMASYSAGDYTAAAAGLSELLEADPADHKLRIYLGIACLELGDTSRAVEVLEPAFESEGLIAERAYWYVGMAHLRRDDGAAARRSFQKLRDLEGSYRRNAVEMLERLDEVLNR